MLSAIFHSGGAGGVKCYNGGHFPPIRQDGRFNYVLQAVLCRLPARQSQGCHDAVLSVVTVVTGRVVVYAWAGWGHSLGQNIVGPSTCHTRAGGTSGTKSVSRIL